MKRKEVEDKISFYFLSKGSLSGDELIDAYETGHFFGAKSMFSDRRFEFFKDAQGAAIKLFLYMCCMQNEKGEVHIPPVLDNDILGLSGNTVNLMLNYMGKVGAIEVVRRGYYKILI